MTGSARCAMAGCELPPLAGDALCADHADLAAGRDTPGTRRLLAESRERTMARIANDVAAIRATRPAAVPTGPAAIICPHCQVRGKVTSRRTRQKKGVSGGKATGALLTAGISLLATGLSRKEKVTELRCGNCRTVWYV